MRQLFMTQDKLPHTGTASTSGVTFASGECLIDGTDTCSIVATGLSPRIGWVAVCFRSGWANAAEPEGGAGYPYALRWTASGGNEDVTIAYQESDNTWIYQRTAGGVGQNAFSAADTIASGDIVVLILKWDLVGNGLSIDGGSFTVNAAPLIPALTDATALLIGHSGSNQQIDFYYRHVLWGRGTLTDGDAATIDNLLRNNHPNPAAVIPVSAMVCGYWACGTPVYKRIAG